MLSVNNQKTSGFVRGKGLFLLLKPRLSMTTKPDSNSQDSVTLRAGFAALTLSTPC